MARGRTSKGRWRARLALCPLAVLIAACGELATVAGPAEATGRAGPTGSMAAQDTALGATAKLRVGGSLTVGGEALEVRFDRVSEDSRCPIGVTCVWEGDAVVRVTVTKGASAGLELHTQVNFPREATYAGYRVRLADLAPLPEANRPVDPAAYVASLVITKAS